jgi:hypothetical protein
VVNGVGLFTGFCYTQFTDTYQEANGLLYMDRTPKFDLAQMDRATRGDAGTVPEPGLPGSPPMIVPEHAP